MPSHLGNEKGSVMLFTMMFILIITVMGLIATQTSIFEIKISENNRRYNEEFSAAEVALNHAIVDFRNLPVFTKTVTTTGENGEEASETKSYTIERVLNDRKYKDDQTACYIHGGYPVNTPYATIEIRRIVESSVDVAGLSEQANNVPTGLTHRYYSGSIDKRRFAITATALGRNSSIPSTTWVQKGISLPAEQDKDIF